MSRPVVNNNRQRYCNINFFFFFFLGGGLILEGSFITNVNQKRGSYIRGGLLLEEIQ